MELDHFFTIYIIVFGDIFLNNCKSEVCIEMIIKKIRVQQKLMIDPSDKYLISLRDGIYFNLEGRASSNCLISAELIKEDELLHHIQINLIAGGRFSNNQKGQLLELYPSDEINEEIQSYLHKINENNKNKEYNVEISFQLPTDIHDLIWIYKIKVPKDSWEQKLEIIYWISDLHYKCIHKLQKIIK